MSPAKARHSEACLFSYHRTAAALCALVLFSAAATTSFAEEEVPRLRPTSRGDRVDAVARDNTPPLVVPSTPTPARPTEPVAPPAPPHAPTPEPPPLGNRLRDAAMTYLGHPYAWGGATPAGFDCSGFVQWVLGEHGLAIGRVVGAQFSVGQEVDADSLRPGDLVFFRNTYVYGLSHVGIYVGDGRFVDAGTERTGVRIAEIWDPYWGPRFAGARRLVS